MNIENIVEYASGYVGATGGKVELRTTDIDAALAWTKSHTGGCDLAVCKGLTIDDCCCEEQITGYIEEHMNENIIAFNGEFTNLFLDEVAKLSV